MNNKAFYERRLEEHKRLYELAINADDDKEIKFQAQEMRNLRELIKACGEVAGC